MFFLMKLSKNVMPVNIFKKITCIRSAHLLLKTFENQTLVYNLVALVHSMNV